MWCISIAVSCCPRYDECAGILDQLSSVVEQADDLRAKALYEFYTFDAHLECGECVCVCLCVCVCECVCVCAGICGSTVV